MANNEKLTLPTSVKEPTTQVTKSAPRSALDIYDWDNITRKADVGEQERMFIPPHLVPDGFSIEWKRISTLGMPDSANITRIEAAGWRPAPSELFREVLPSNYSDPFVEDGQGLRLYIRPMKFTKEATEQQYNIAAQKVKDYETTMKNPLNVHRDAPTKVHAFSRSYEKGIPVPD